MTVLDISATEALAGDFAGDLVTPDHPAYDAQRQAEPVGVLERHHR